MKKEFEVIRKILPIEICNYLCDYSLIKASALKKLRENNLISPYDIRFGIFGDDQVPNPETFCIYGDSAFDILLIKFQSIIEEKIKKQLIPTYSYMRIYQKGDTLKKHIDRNECEFSITLNLGGAKWPIYLNNKKVILKQGDLLIYKGCETEHWREPLKEKNCFQVFLHYNNLYQKDTSTLYDKRDALGISTKDGVTWKPFT